MKGILLINKSSGFSTNEILVKIKEKLKIKIGFSGTLDPLAEGLILFLLGNSTKLSDYFFFLPKTYFVIVKVNYSTITDDIFGKKNSIDLIKKIKEKKKKFFLSIINKKFQIPHKFSSNKIKNIRNFKKSRKNKKFKIKSKKIYIDYFEIKKKRKKKFKIKIKCKTGTYIRSLIRDINFIFKINLTVICLKRISIGKYKIKNSILFLNKINKNFIIKNLIK